MVTSLWLKVSLHEKSDSYVLNVTSLGVQIIKFRIFCKPGFQDSLGNNSLGLSVS